MVRRRLSRLFDPGALGAGPPPRSGPPTTTGVRPRPHRPTSIPAVRPGVLPPSSVATGHSAQSLEVADEEAASAAAVERDVPFPAASRLPGPGAFDPGRRGIRALAVVAAVVVVGAGLWAWRSGPHAEPVRPVSTIAAPAGPEASAAGPAGAGNGQLVVAVAGKVRRPGLVRVPAGSRVADAVEAAGGALPGVDLALLNPARKLTDGELILVGVAAPPGQPGQPAAAAAPAAGGAVPGAPVNLNTATLAQLDALPGVGPVLAQRILTHREQHGGFRSVADLRQVEGIGDARYEQLKDLVTV